MNWTTFDLGRADVLIHELPMMTNRIVSRNRGGHLIRPEFGDDRSERHYPKRARRPMSVPRRPLSVLVVDDYPDTAESCATLIALLGDTVRIARTGEEALRLAAAAMPDVVLLDILLPDLDGCEVARQLARVVAGKPPLVVAVTGCEREADRIRITQAGCHLHLVKPVEPAILTGLLNRFRQALTCGPRSESLPPRGPDTRSDTL